MLFFFNCYSTFLLVVKGVSKRKENKKNFLLARNRSREICLCVNALPLGYVTRAIFRHKHGYFSCENVFGSPLKLLLWTKKKNPKGTSSAVFKGRTAAKCCEFKPYFPTLIQTNAGSTLPSLK